jgi:hypothetical protein
MLPSIDIVNNGITAVNISFSPFKAGNVSVCFRSIPILQTGEHKTVFFTIERDGRPSPLTKHSIENAVRELTQASNHPTLRLPLQIVCFDSDGRKVIIDYEAEVSVFTKDMSLTFIRREVVD